jgi:hypothetical protein
MPAAEFPSERAFHGSFGLFRRNGGMRAIIQCILGFMPRKSDFNPVSDVFRGKSIGIERSGGFAEIRRVRKGANTRAARHASVGQVIIPNELEIAVTKGGLEPIAETGVIYNLLADRWQRSTDMDVNYMLVAERSREDPARL